MRRAGEPAGYDSFAPILLLAGIGQGIVELLSGACVYFRGGAEAVLTFLLWCLLLVVCWPLALVALLLYPLVWLLLLPFRIIGIAVGGVLELLWAVVTLPARVLGGGRRL